MRFAATAAVLSTRARATHLRRACVTDGVVASSSVGVNDLTRYKGIERYKNVFSYQTPRSERTLRRAHKLCRLSATIAVGARHSFGRQARQSPTNTDSRCVLFAAVNLMLLLFTHDTHVYTHIKLRGFSKQRMCNLREIATRYRTT